MVGGKGLYGRPGSRKKGSIYFLAVEGDQPIKAVGQSKDNMIVRDREKFTFPVQDPSFPVGGLALWAVPVAAGVVADFFFATIATSCQVPT